MDCAYFQQPHLTFHVKDKAHFSHESTLTI